MQALEAHTLGERAFLGTFLLRVYFGTILPIVIEIVSYLIEKEQKISWHNFLTRCSIVPSLNTYSVANDLHYAVHAKLIAVFSLARCLYIAQ